MTDEPDDLSRRVARLEASEAIVRLCADYCHGADLRDLDLFMSVWSADAVWQVRDDLAFTGSDEIRSAIQQQWTTCRRAFHWTSNRSILVSDDARTARARFEVRSEVELLDGTWIRILGSYHDEYRVEPGGWRMTRRTAVVHTQRPI